MKLYHHPISTYSQKVLIALYEKGLDFEAEIVQLMDPEKRLEYREVYPMGKVPMLKDGDDMVPESSIIIEYIDHMAAPTLIKGNAEQQRKIRFKDRMFDLYLNEAVVTLLFQGMKPEEQRDAERIESSWHRINTMYMFMENEFGNQDYDVSPDGRFVMVKSGDSLDSRHRINVIQNWTQYLLERVPVP